MRRRPILDTDDDGERTLTERDWKALYLVMKLMQQIVFHGAQALDTFIDAMIEIRAAIPARPSESQPSTTDATPLEDS